jgi:hypothetical protein
LPRTLRTFVLAALVALVLVLSAAPAGARELIGCNGIVQWPCPGPVLIDP